MRGITGEQHVECRLELTDKDGTHEAFISSLDGTSMVFRDAGRSGGMRFVRPDRAWKKRRPDELPDVNLHP